MTLDEAIRHCLEQARKLQDKADRVGDDESRQCMECAADHIQLAEWLQELKERRAADVQPVKRGKWRFTEKLILGNHLGSYQCSECMYRVPCEENYCPNCGADMRGEDSV